MMASFWKNPTIRLISYFLTVAAVVLIVLMIDILRLPLIVSVLFCYMMAPVVDALERRGLSRGVAVLVVFAAIAVVIFFPAYLMTPVIVDAYRNLIEAIPAKLIAAKLSFESFLQRYGGNLPVDFQASLVQETTGFVQKTAMSTLQAIPKWLPNLLTSLLLFPVFSFFLLRDSNYIGKALLQPIPNRYFEISVRISHMVNSKVGAYIRGRLTETLVVWVIVTVGLLIIRFPYAFLHGMFAAILNLVPFIGPFIGAAPALLISIVDFQSAFQVSAVVCVFGLAQLIDNMYVFPVILGRAIDMHPIWVIIAIFAGSQFYGVLGMLISVPVVAIFRIMIEESIRGFASLK